MDNIGDEIRCYVCNCELNKKRKGDTDTCVCLDCRKGQSFISKTKAKKEYYLTDEDLDDVFSMDTHSNTYGKSQTITLYLESEIITTADNKFGNFNEYKENKERQKQDRKNKREEKKNSEINNRKNMVRDIFKKHKFKYELDDTLEMYIEEGNNGIRKFNRSNDKFMEKLPRLRTFAIIRNEDLEDNLEEITDSNQLEQYIIDLNNSINTEKERRKILNEALIKRGLKLRSDSKVCTAYIEGGIEEVMEIDYGLKSVDDIVNLMEEMSFYFNKTNYKKIFGSLKNKNMNKEYYMRSSIDELNCDAKITALNTFIKENKDNYMNIVPKSLIAKIK